MINNNIYSNGNGNNNLRNGIKKRIQSAKPKMRTDLKKNMTMNNMSNNLNIEKNGDEIIASDMIKDKNKRLPEFSESLDFIGCGGRI